MLQQSLRAKRTVFFAILALAILSGCDRTSGSDGRGRSGRLDGPPSTWPRPTRLHPKHWELIPANEQPFLQSSEQMKIRIKSPIALEPYAEGNSGLVAFAETGASTTVQQVLLQNGRAQYDVRAARRSGEVFCALLTSNSGTDPYSFFRADGGNLTALGPEALVVSTSEAAVRENALEPWLVYRRAFLKRLSQSIRGRTSFYCARFQEGNTTTTVTNSGVRAALGNLIDVLVTVTR